MASSVRSGYFASLYFWIDLAATLSMLLDITRLMDLIFQQSTPAGADALTRPDQNKVVQLSDEPASLQGDCGGAWCSTSVQQALWAGHILAARCLAGPQGCCRLWQHGFTGASAAQVLLRLRQILRVTRIFRLMRVLKLFQQYLVRPCGSTCVKDQECCDIERRRASIPALVKGLSGSGSADTQRESQI